MSQAKVDQYKKEKANRKETLAKEKRVKRITKLCTGVVVVVLGAWIGVSAVDAVKDSQPVKTIYCETAELDNYLSSLYEAAEVEETTESEETTEAEETTESEETRTLYATTSVNVRSGPSVEDSQVGRLSENEEVIAIGEADENGWQKVLFEDAEAYVLVEYLAESPIE